ncbi:MAG: tyrosine-type recombinase/integrase, partial [Candidatus Scalindua sp.]
MTVPVKFLTQGEFERLIGNCESWLRPLVIIARYRGLRMGNALKLTWNQVNLFKREIIIGETKNGEPIGFPICDTLFETLTS